jgi:ribosome recycling factor
MKRNIQILLGEMEGRLNGYATLLNYRYMNLCVKAEPASLIPIVIRNLDGDEANFEDIANVMFADEYTFEILPNEQEMITNICKSLKETHPEFKLEVVKAAEENMLNTESDDEEEYHIICRMPEVNDDRYDILMDGVKVLYDQCMIEVGKVKASYTARLTTLMLGQSKEAIEEAKGSLEERMNQYTGFIDNYRTNKEKEMEDAHQKWMNEQNEESRHNQESAAAQGNDKGQSFNMYDDE